MAQTAAQKKAAEKKFVAEAQALIAKQNAQLAALEKQQAAAAKIKADFDAEQKLAKEEAVKQNAAARIERIRNERLAAEALAKTNAGINSNLKNLFIFLKRKLKVIENVY